MSSANTSSGSRWPHLHRQGPRLGRPGVCADQPCRAADDSGWVTSGATGIRVRDRVGRVGDGSARADSCRDRRVRQPVRGGGRPRQAGGVRRCRGARLSRLPPVLLSVPGAQPARRLVRGGLPANRARIVVRIVEGIKERLGSDYSVSVRLNVCDGIPNGLEPPAAAELARIFQGAGADVINTSAGTYESGSLIRRQRRPAARA